MSIKNITFHLLILSLAACGTTSTNSEAESIEEVANVESATVSEEVMEKDLPAEEDVAETVTTANTETPGQVKEIDASILEAPLPMIKRALSPVSLKYATTIAFEDENLDIDMTATVSELDDMWKVSSLSTGIIGEVHDECHIDKKSFESRYRMMKQGPSLLELNYDGKMATGRTVSGNNESEVSTDLEGPAFCSGPAMPFTIASLDLAKGFEDTFRVFNPSNKSTSYMIVSVVGEESLTVDAGTFETFKVEISNADQSPGTISLWVDKASPMVIKSQQSMPQMGGAVMETVLKLVE